jgi:hypothetical protein
MGGGLLRVGAGASLIISVLALAWVVRATSRPFPALTQRPIVGAPLDAPAGSRPERGEEEMHFPLPATGPVAIDLVQLAFDDYDPPEIRGAGARALGPEDFPERIASLHEREVELEGFPLITRLAGERADRLLLTRFPPGCCFGTVPVLDEWIAVELEEGRADPGMGYDPIRVRGKFFAGELLDENGFVESLYRLSAALVLE